MDRGSSLHHRQRLAMHSGDTAGQHAMLVLAPELKFALILLTNRQPAGTIAEVEVLAEAARQYLGLDKEADRVGMIAPLLALDVTPVTLPPETLAEYAGRYESPHVAYNLRVENDELIASVEALPLPDLAPPDTRIPSPQDTPVAFIREDLAVVGGGVTPFVRRPDGDVGWLATGLRLYPKVGME